MIWIKNYFSKPHFHLKRTVPAFFTLSLYNQNTFLEKIPVKFVGFQTSQETFQRRHVKRRTIPVKRRHAPANCRIDPVKHRTTPIKNRTVPVKSWTVPVKHRTTPAKHRTTLVKRRTVPAKRRTFATRHYFV